jgi:hypothetical protein
LFRIFCARLRFKSRASSRACRSAMEGERVWRALGDFWMK